MHIDILWWNINRKPNIILIPTSPTCTITPSIIFISEVSIGHGGLPKIPNYTLISDTSVATRNHGGIAVYIKDNIVNHVFQVQYNTCYVAFRLDFCQNFMFIGVYIQPESSKYFSPNMFSDVASLLLDCKEKSIVPIVGGDFNARPGDLNTYFNSMNYTSNIDRNSNNHGKTYFPDICKTGDIFPLNHLKYKKKQYTGAYTYHKTGKNSQIDFVLTNRLGMNYITDFQIPSSNWHLSDHRPVYINMKVSEICSATGLLNRARDLNYEYNPNEFTIKRYTKQYNFGIMQDYFEQNIRNIETDVINSIDASNIESAIETLNSYIGDAHKHSKVTTKNSTNTASTNNAELMMKTNEAYENYQNVLADSSSTQDDMNSALNTYDKTRKTLTYDILSHETSKWIQYTSSQSTKDLWNKIDWKGNTKSKPTKHPMIDELQLHYEELYSRDESEEAADISNLTTNVHIPLLDNPILPEEITDAKQSMKKGGYDYQIQVLKILSTTFMPLLVLIMNFMFFLKYPINLACSLLISLPKKGNLSLPKNWRGIQMLPAIAALYDRILANRLHKWIGVDDEQTAFQKGKSTIHQLFTLRLLIALAYKLDITLYLGFFDIEKAFDKISRLLLLKKLISLGIGYCMLNALKMLYMPTFCILNFYGQTSKRFETCSGIRQGAASSVFLFIVFINDLINYLKTKCIEEPLIGNMHSLLHADDTAIISTNRLLFIEKCNHMLVYFHTNKLGLNLGKSGYMIINGKPCDKKCTLKLNNGTLLYKSKIIYLGALFSDTGNMNNDIGLHIAEKRPNITVKYNNFCSKNYLSPITIKLKVLNSCAISSLSYSSETWGKYNGKGIETLVRTGIKTALSIRNNTPNEITYIESDQYPLECSILKQQLKFWLNMEQHMKDNPQTPLSILISLAQTKKLPYITHYMKLKEKYTSPENCMETLKSEYRLKWTTQINKASIDPDSKLGAYKRVNPDLISPIYKVSFETERILLTRYRTGNHNLQIEKGRFTYPRIPREERLCLCNTSVQTLEHCLLSCPLLAEARQNLSSAATLFEAIQDTRIHSFLLKMEKELHIKNY